jgi:hypothetical protein
MFILFDCVTRRGKEEKAEHLEGKGGEQAMGILRFQGGSPHLCQLRPTSFWPRWASLELYWPYVWFYGAQ